MFKFLKKITVFLVLLVFLPNVSPMSEGFVDHFTSGQVIEQLNALDMHNLYDNYDHHSDIEDDLLRSNSGSKLNLVESPPYTRSNLVRSYSDHGIFYNELNLYKIIESLVQDRKPWRLIPFIKRCQELNLLEGIIDKANTLPETFGLFNFACGHFCLFPNLGTVKILLKYGFNPNGSEYNYPPLNSLIMFDCTCLLTNVKKNVSDEVYDGFKKKVLNCIKYNVKILKTLLKNGAYPNRVDITGVSPLNLASFFGKHKMINVLLEFGADVNLEDDDRNTPLHAAVNCPYLPWVKSVKILLEAKADPTIVNWLQKKPLDIVLDNLNNTVLKMFFSAIPGIFQESISFKKNNINLLKDISSYLGLIEMIHLILNSNLDLEKLCNLEALKNKLGKVLNRTVKISDFCYFVRIFKTDLYKSIFIESVKQLNLIDERNRMQNFSDYLNEFSKFF